MASAAPPPHAIFVYESVRDLPSRILNLPNSHRLGLLPPRLVSLPIAYEIRSSSFGVQSDIASPPLAAKSSQNPEPSPAKGEEQDRRQKEEASHSH